jgi:hypothetical protein
MIDWDTSARSDVVVEREEHRENRNGYGKILTASASMQARVVFPLNRIKIKSSLILHVTFRARIVKTVETRKAGRTKASASLPVYLVIFRNPYF